MRSLTDIQNRVLLVLCFTTFLLSCENDGSSRYDTGKLKVYDSVDSLSLSDPEIDTLTIGHGMLPAYMDYQVVSYNETNLFIGLNSEYYSLDVIDLDQGTTVGKLTFEQQVPNGIKGNIDGFYYHNADSIFLLTIDENSIYLMGSDLKVKDIYRFNNVPLPDGFRDYDAYAEQGIKYGPYYVESNKTLQFNTYRWVDNSVVFDYQTFASYSIVDRKFIATYGDYPKNYERGTNFLIYDDPGLLVIDTLSYVYFGGAPEIFCYNNSTGDLVFVTNQSSKYYTGPPTPLYSTQNEFQKEQDWLIESAAYISLETDLDGSVIYRFLKHKQPVLNSGGLANGRWFGEWSITMHDPRDLRQIGVYQIPKNTYYPPISFATNDHLWIKSAVSEKYETEAFYAKFKPIKKDASH